MFISFLYPFRLRGRIAPYLWIAYKQITDLPPGELAFIASADYFIDPDTFRQAQRFETSWPENPELRFRVPTATQLRAYPRRSVPDAIYRRLKEIFIADALVWNYLIRQIDEELVAFIVEAVHQLAARPVDALLTWCHFASLSEAGRRLGIPVIHTELGPLRYPHYRSLAYFDFSGVNGNTEAERRFHRYAQTRAQNPPPLRADQLRSLLSLPRENPEPWDEPEYELGIPLQVEDDSNVLAYGRGFDLARILQYALEEGEGSRLLIRPHPGARWRWVSREYDLDDSPSPRAFLRRCRRILSLNSSLAIEALLLGLPVAILGDSPARFAAGRSLDQMRRATDEELDFLLVHYCIPYRLLFDAAYLRWRLTYPSETAIRIRHLQALGADAATLPLAP